MKATEVIDGAIEAVTGNWCQNNLFTESGQLCLRGALFVGAGARLETIVFQDGSSMLDLVFPDEYDPEACSKADQAVRDQLELENTAELPEWNDDPGTSEEDVILVLKRARELIDE